MSSEWSVPARPSRQHEQGAAVVHPSARGDRERRITTADREIPRARFEERTGGGDSTSLPLSAMFSLFDQAELDIARYDAEGHLRRASDALPHALRATNGGVRQLSALLQVALQVIDEPARDVGATAQRIWHHHHVELAGTRYACRAWPKSFTATNRRTGAVTRYPREQFA